MKKLLIVAACLFAPQAQAQYMAYGVGVSKCFELTNNTYNTAFQLMFDSWLAGFISGVNVATNALTNGSQATYGMADITASVDINIISGYVKTYCRRNPRESIADATGETIAAMFKSR